MRAGEAPRVRPGQLRSGLPHPNCSLKSNSIGWGEHTRASLNPNPHFLANKQCTTTLVTSLPRQLLPETPQGTPRAAGTEPPGPAWVATALNAAPQARNDAPRSSQRPRLTTERKLCTTPASAGAKREASQELRAAASPAGAELWCYRRPRAAPPPFGSPQSSLGRRVAAVGVRAKGGGKGS